MRESSSQPYHRLLPLALLAALLVIWGTLSAQGVFREYSVFPSLPSVVNAFGEEARGNRLTENAVASLFRVGLGFGLAVALSLPLGLAMGHSAWFRATMMPFVNFFRSLSPLAWIPFAVAWFKIGDAPAVFLIFLSTFFPLTLAICASVASIPRVYFQVGRDHGLKGAGLLMGITLPAIMPEFITSLRVTAGVAWMVVVAAEMLAGRDGLGFAVWDSRNGLRVDLLIVQMLVIGGIGVALDRLIVQLTRIPSVRWGYER